MIFLFILLFIISSLVLFFSSSRLIDNLMMLSRFLSWREFVASFFVMSLATSLPNFFIDINAAISGVPELAFGDIVGGNILDLTLAIALTVILGKTFLPAKSEMVQTSAIFTVAIAILPLLMIFDGNLSTVDGLLLILSFLIYTGWIFSKNGRFKKYYNRGRKEKIVIKKKEAIVAGGWILLFSGLMFVASEGIIISAQKFSEIFKIGLPAVGILIVGVANCVPETYSSIICARKKQTWSILGNLMGSVLICSTLVLGLVAIIHPIQNIDFSPFFIARMFLALAALFFLIVIRTDEKITRNEGIILLVIYIMFIICEITLNQCIICPKI